MDVDYLYEVWNQPILSYEYSYFNPATKKAVHSLKNARIELSHFPEDHYRNVRSPEAVAIVGIAMDVYYVTEVEPKHRPKDSVSNDKTTMKRWLYDIELDQNGKIVGGEWYQLAHPDFLWSPLKESKTQTAGDQWLEESRSTQSWSSREPLPTDWQKAAHLGASKSQPLRKIVEQLILFSKLYK